MKTAANISPLLVFPLVDKRTNDESIHTALVRCYHQGGYHR